MDDSDLVCFVLHSDMAAQNEVLDRYLNQPSGGVVAYRAIAPFVILYIADFRAAFSGNFAQAGTGQEREHEVGFWQPALDVKSGHFAWFPSYVFTDTTTTVITGREVFGFPKQGSSIRTPRWSDPTGSALELRTAAFRTFGYGAEPEPHCLVRAERVSGEGHLLGEQFESIVDAVTGVTSRLPETQARPTAGHRSQRISYAPPVLGTGRVIRAGRQRTSGAPRLVPVDEPVPSPSLLTTSDVFEIGAALLEQRTELVFLKQFRDAEVPEMACYQAIVHGAFKVLGFRTAGILNGTWNVTVARLASEPVFDELGLDKGAISDLDPSHEKVTLEPVVGFGVQMDLEFGHGAVRWEAGGTQR